MGTVVCEARHIPTRPMGHLVAVEGVTFSEPLAIEQVMHTVEHEIEVVKLAVWHDRGWMFGIELAVDDVVTVEYDTNLVNVPAPPSREGQVRVHGTWKQRGEVDWAPNGYPAPM